MTIAHVQLILSGDFFQLPPVPDRLDGVDVPSAFAFEAESWESCIGRPYFLNKVFRQKEQGRCFLAEIVGCLELKPMLYCFLVFVDILNSMRFGNMTSVTIQRLHALSREIQYQDGILPTDLWALTSLFLNLSWTLRIRFPTKAEVERRNHACLNAIRSRPYQYKSLDTPGCDQFGQLHNGDKLGAILDRLIAPSSVSLKVYLNIYLYHALCGLLVHTRLEHKLCW